MELIVLVSEVFSLTILLAKLFKVAAYNITHTLYLDKHVLTHALY